MCHPLRQSTSQPILLILVRTSCTIETLLSIYLWSMIKWSSRILVIWRRWWWWWCYLTRQLYMHINIVVECACSHLKQLIFQMFTFIFTYPISMFALTLAFAFAFVFKYVLCVLFCLSHICHLFDCFSIKFFSVPHLFFFLSLLLQAVAVFFIHLFVEFHIFACVRLRSQKVDIQAKQTVLMMERAIVREIGLKMC